VTKKCSETVKIFTELLIELTIAHLVSYTLCFGVFW